jgi:quercetin 2,3-dioxygenase
MILLSMFPHHHWRQAIYSYPCHSHEMFMSEVRKVKRVIIGQRTSDGAGVKLTRMFGRDETTMMDPFLMLDHFGSDRPEDYMAGFPMHPHRGIETVTYMMEGRVDHRDSMGNEGTIGPGDLQWMTAGSGILHEEMPYDTGGPMRGFQLWVNLPKASKMTAPKYRGIVKDDIPVVDLGAGSSVKVIAGDFDGTKGAVSELTMDVGYFDVGLMPRTVIEYEVPRSKNAFAVVYDGEIMVGEERKKVRSGELAVLGVGDRAMAEVGGKAAKFLFVSGTPLREPIAWGGPIVMNTDEELGLAFDELRKGTFIKDAR